MIKLLIYVVLGYLLYKTFINPKKIDPPKDNNIKNRNDNNKIDYTDYEEVD
ncbi:MAG: hypothetical protein R2771_07245 [Saprospiraceae bacterium]